MIARLVFRERLLRRWRQQVERHSSLLEKICFCHSPEGALSANIKPPRCCTCIACGLLTHCARRQKFFVWLQAQWFS